jgi:hypothetical protein
VGGGVVAQSVVRVRVRIGCVVRLEAILVESSRRLDMRRRMALLLEIEGTEVRPAMLREGAWAYRAQGLLSTTPCCTMFIARIVEWCTW